MHAVLVWSMYSQLPTNTSLNPALLMVVDLNLRYQFFHQLHGMYVKIKLSL